MATALIQALQLFNRKERYHLIRFAMEDRIGDWAKEGVPFSSEFVERLNESGAIGSSKIPQRPFLAIDFHLDWLAAAIALSNYRKNTWEELLELKGHEATKWWQDQFKVAPFKASQEDIDLLLAFSPDGHSTTLILAECKYDEGWKPKQLNRKLSRLGEILGDSTIDSSNIVANFLLVSPGIKPKITSNKSTLKAAPKWASQSSEIQWVQLAHAPHTARLEECDRNGEKRQAGNYWRLRPARTKNVRS